MDFAVRQTDLTGAIGVADNLGQDPVQMRPFIADGGHFDDGHLPLVLGVNLGNGDSVGSPRVFEEPFQDAPLLL